MRDLTDLSSEKAMRTSPGPLAPGRESQCRPCPGGALVHSQGQLPLDRLLRSRGSSDIGLIGARWWGYHRVSVCLARGSQPEAQAHPECPRGAGERNERRAVHIVRDAAWTARAIQRHATFTHEFTLHFSVFILHFALRSGAGSGHEPSSSRRVACFV